MRTSSDPARNKLTMYARPCAPGCALIDAHEQRIINLKVAEIQKNDLFIWKELDKDTQERVQNEVIRELEEEKLPEAKPGDVKASMAKRLSRRKYDGT